ncbi:ubiquitin C-terminal hydrolase 12-like isoform X1 [Pyrus x bretschneideri]|uniref:ubiquitin C-terminal hydrolase 12-like isoform X1 n=1 Tax=Pyrus x bretschneideri TaxID=225117 RepID=UPI00203050D3|nr:ubiquitin C-terminal hydrolase 12-like isoform X1 [Pyrus x bretschneideri]
MTTSSRNSTSMKIEDGDIICFQKSTPLGSEEELKYSNVPSFLTRLKKEQEEDKKRYKAQAHLYTTIKVARDEDLVKQIGRDIYFDLVDHDKVRSFTIKKQMPFNLFKGLVALECIPMQFQQFWIWAMRQNHTYRPIQPLTPEEQLESVKKLEGLPNKEHKNCKLKLFLEDLGLDQRPIPLPDKTKEDILLFFKLYEPEKQKLGFVGRFFVKSLASQ